MKIIYTYPRSYQHVNPKKPKRYVADWPCVPREGDSVVIDDMCYDVQVVLWDIERDEVEVRLK